MKKLLKSFIMVAICFILSVNAMPCTPARAETAAPEYSELIAELIAAMPQGLDDLEKAVYFHDYFVSLYKYDTSYSIYTGYEFLLYGTGVCQAYAEAYMDVMNALGIECHMATSRKANHAWNVIGLGGSYYHVDCTFDDPLGQECGRALHEYLLISTETLYNTDTSHDRTDWVIDGKSNISCTSKAYEGYSWADIEAPFAYCGGAWYALNTKDYAVYKKSELTDAGELLFKLGERWPVIGTPNAYWIGCFSGLFSIGNKLYGNTPGGLWSFDTCAGSLEKLQFFNTEVLNAYGSAYIGSGIILIEAGNDINSYEREYHTLFTPLLTTENFSTAEMLINARRATLFSEYNPLLDVNDDGAIEIRDLIRIKKYIAEEESSAIAL